LPFFFFDLQALIIQQLLKLPRVCPKQPNRGVSVYLGETETYEMNIQAAPPHGKVTVLHAHRTQLLRRDTPPLTSPPPQALEKYTQHLDTTTTMRAARVSPLLAAATVACLAAGVVTSASAAAAATAGTHASLGHRKLLSHNEDNFRVLEEGGAHNALSAGDVADQVSATTCLPQDDFVRTSGGKFTLGGRETRTHALDTCFRVAPLSLLGISLFCFFSNVFCC
jgi:hypothetical protein